MSGCTTSLAYIALTQQVIHISLQSDSSSEDDDEDFAVGPSDEVLGVLDKEKKKPAWEDEDDEQIRSVAVPDFFFFWGGGWARRMKGNAFLRVQKFKDLLKMIFLLTGGK